LADKEREIAKLRADAERYRWIRSYNGPDAALLVANWCDDELDVKIDKAMSGEIVEEL
jgi:hypothetical protein